MSASISFLNHDRAILEHTLDMMFATFWLLIVSVFVFEHLANARSLPSVLREKQEKNDNSRLVLRMEYNPKITSPNAATTWVVGSTVTVTW
jgi:hypothetical protein